MSATNLFILIWPFIYCIFRLDCIYGTGVPTETLHRSRRQLLFPNSTLLQLNGGLATPSPREKVFVNWAFQANFQLPWNRSQIPLDILETDPGTYFGTSRRKREVEDERRIEYENDARLYHFYKYVEGVLDGFGHNGSSCLLQTLCQIGSQPLHTDDDEDLLHELAGFVLNPNNDAEFTAYKKESQLYIDAYERGKDKEDCSNLYPSCSISVLDLFSKPYIT